MDNRFIQMFPKSLGCFSQSISLLKRNLYQCRISALVGEILMTLTAFQKRLKKHCCGAPVLCILTPLKIRTLISSG